VSGWAILQNGRIAGAVTDVSVNAPAKGHGVLPETMLNAVRSRKKTEAAPLSFSV